VALFLIFTDSLPSVAAAPIKAYFPGSLKYDKKKLEKKLFFKFNRYTIKIRIRS
jgi:hypothetical protein